MSRYVLLLKATESGASRMLLSGGSGANKQREAIEQLGGTKIEQLVVTGSYDVVITCDLPDPLTSLAVGLALEAGGFYADVLSAFTPDEVDQARAKLPQLPAPEVDGALGERGPQAPGSTE